MCNQFLLVVMQIPEINDTEWAKHSRERRKRLVQKCLVIAKNMTAPIFYFYFYVFCFYKNPVLTLSDLWLWELAPHLNCLRQVIPRWLYSLSLFRRENFCLRGPRCWERRVASPKRWDRWRRARFTSYRCSEQRGAGFHAAGPRVSQLVPFKCSSTKHLGVSLYFSCLMITIIAVWFRSFVQLPWYPHG